MIFFDIDDTLVTHSQAQSQAARLFWEAFADRLPYSQPEFPAVWDAVMRTHFAAFAAGQISFAEHRRRRVREIFADAVSDSEAGALFQAYLRHYEDCWALFDDVLLCLDALRSFPLGIISNGNGKQQRRKLHRLGIAERFQVVIISEEVGLWKPKAEMFWEACRQAETDPGECVYVGDSLTTDALASQAAGMRGVWLNRTQLSAAELWVPAIACLRELHRLVERKIT